MVAMGGFPGQSGSRGMLVGSPEYIAKYGQETVAQAQANLDREVRLGFGPRIEAAEARLDDARENNAGTITSHPHSEHSNRPWECRICKSTRGEHAS